MKSCTLPPQMKVRIQTNIARGFLSESAPTLWTYTVDPLAFSSSFHTRFDCEISLSRSPSVSLSVN